MLNGGPRLALNISRVKTTVPSGCSQLRSPIDVWRFYGVLIALTMIGSSCSNDSAGRASPTDSALAVSRDTLGVTNRIASDATLTLRTTPRVADALRVVADSFAKREAVRVVLDTLGFSGNIDSYRRDGTDVFALDAPTMALLVVDSSEVSWSVQATIDRVVIAYLDSVRVATSIDSTNWRRILTERKSRVLRADPNAEKSGSDALLTMKLAEAFYKDTSLFAKLEAGSRAIKMSTRDSLLAALARREADFIWCYESFARSSGLSYLRLPAAIDLGSPALAQQYSMTRVSVAQSPTGSHVFVQGRPIGVRLSIPAKAVNGSLAERFVRYVVSADGRRVLAAVSIQVPGQLIILGRSAPISVSAMADSVLPLSGR